MSLYDMSEADKQWLRTEIRSELGPILEELKAIKKELAELNKQELDERYTLGTVHTLAYAFAHSQAGITPDEQAQAARRAEATTEYDGAAVEKDEGKEVKSGSDEVVRSGKTD